MSMCVWNMIKTCMLDGIPKLYACNKYPRNYVMTIEYIVCMMYDKINMHTLTIPTIKWKYHINELRFCKMLKHACKFTRNKKIGNIIALVRGKVTHDLCVLRKIHDVCNSRVGVELKNQTTSKHFYSKAIIQPSPQIKLWGGYGFRANRKTSYTKLWKIPHLLIFLHIGENMAAASTTNVEVEMGMVDENEIISSSQKRPTMAQVTISQKKAKGKMVVEPKRPPFWLGFQAMNWTNRSKDYPIDRTELISELIRKGMEIDEATECQQATPVFPFVIQEEWPSIRDDGIEGQHFNLTQIPFDVEVDENGFALDYQIAIAFEIGELKVSKEKVMEKVKERLKKMKIIIGSMIGEPIAIMCYHKSTTWSGVVKIHLQNPKKDGIALFQGSRAFILNLDEKMDRRGKVCKTYYALALNNLLSVKIMSEKLKGKEWYNVFEDIVIEGFKRGHEYEVTNVQKKKDFDFAWVVAPSPEQAKKINTYKIALDNEILDAKFTIREKLTEDDKARKNALILIVNNLNKVKSVEELEYGIKEHMGEKNVISIFFRLEGGKHVGSCNVQCLNAAVYKKFSKKNGKILGKYVEFSPHPKNLDGTNAPSNEELVRLGFQDVNTALANTVEAIENATSKGYNKVDFEKMIEKAIIQGTDDICQDMVILKKDIVKETREYADNVQAQASKTMGIQLALLKKQLAATMQCIDSAAERSEALAIDGNMNLSN